MNADFRRTLSWLHTWTGLTLGLILVLLAVTGAGLVIRLQLEQFTDRDLLQVNTCQQPLPLDTLAANARQVHPEDSLRAIEVSNNSRASILVQFTNLDYVYLDPCSGDVLGQQNEYGGFFGTLDKWHRFRFMHHESGKLIAGWSTALFALVLVMGGLVLWWPRSKAGFRSAVRFNAKLPGTARTLNLHKVAGLYTSLVLLLVTLTALPVSFMPVKQLIYDLADYTAPQNPLSVDQNSKSGFPMELALDKAMALFPDFEWFALNYPDLPNDAIRIEVRDAGAPHINAKSYLFLDAWTGEVLEVRHYDSDTGVGRKIYLYSIALHAALVGGLPYQFLLLVAALSIPVQAYSGFSPYLRRKFRTRPKATLTLKLVRKTREAMDICSFEFADPKGQQLPGFSAGSHVDVHLENGLTRQYSLCNDPLETHRYMIGVLKDPVSRGGSIWLHEQLQEGDEVEISLPKNHFPLAHNSGHSLLIAGGIGITPILCMAERLANIGASFRVIYCAKSRKHAAFLDRIEQSAFSNQVQLYFSGEGNRLDIPELLASHDQETHIYVCGPATFMDAVLDEARLKGWEDSRLHREYFEAVGYSTANDKAFDVKIASTGNVITIPADQSVVKVLQEHGFDIPTSCSEGVCATCLTRVLDGEIEHRDMVLNAAQRARNDQFMPCCSRARSSLLVLDL